MNETIIPITIELKIKVLLDFQREQVETVSGVTVPFVLADTKPNDEPKKTIGEVQITSPGFKERIKNIPKPHISQCDVCEMWFSSTKSRNIHRGKLHKEARPIGFKEPGSGFDPVGLHSQPVAPEESEPAVTKPAVTFNSPTRIKKNVWGQEDETNTPLNIEYSQCANPSCGMRPKFVKGTGFLIYGQEFCSKRCHLEYEEGNHVS